MKLRPIILMILLSTAAVTAAQIRIDALGEDDGALELSYHIDNLLDNNSLDLLQRGIASQVTHHIQLWKQKGFVNPLIKELFLTMRIYYDTWEKKYRIVSEDENRLTTQLETVKERCSALRAVRIVAMKELEPNQDYYLSISVSFQPISAESFTAVSTIFDDGAKKSGSRKGRGGYLSVLVNLLGLGDRKFSLKTPEFRILESGQILFNQ